MVLSFFPSGAREFPGSSVIIRGGVTMPAFKAAQDGNGMILRLFNPSASPADALVEIKAAGIEQTIHLGKYESATYRITDGKLTPCSLIENAQCKMHNAQ
jgi:hypothetical protein